MIPIKKILVIDDESQKNTLEQIKRSLTGCALVEYSQIDVLGEKYQDAEANFLEEELLKDIVEVMRSPWNLILVDYDYGQEDFNGLNVIDKIRSVRKHVDVILYSADQKSVIQNVVGSNLKDMPTEEVVEGINRLMDYKIQKMCRRASYEADVVKFVKQNVAPSPRALLSEMLREHGDKVFNSCCPKLKGKTFREIADILDEENNGNAHEWLKAILEQVIAYLNEVNE